MLGQRYVVKQGDTLSELSNKFLGNASRWKDIYDLNNRADVAAAGDGILDPDMLLIGQVIYIPVTRGVSQSSMTPLKPSMQVCREAAPGRVPVGVGGGRSGGKSKARKIRSIPFKYNFSDLPSIPIFGTGYIGSISLSGSVTLQSEKSIDFIELNQSGYAVKSKTEADAVFWKVAAESSVGWDVKTKKMKIETGFSIRANNPHAPEIGLSTIICDKTMLPGVKGSLKYPPLKGTADGFLYITSDFAIEVEICPLPVSAKPKPIPVRVYQPVSTPVINWDYVFAGALIVGAGVIIVATVAEDIVTLGAGVADDPVSFAAAAAMVTRGATLWRGATVAGGLAHAFP